jgi:hypothetical protein
VEGHHRPDRPRRPQQPAGEGGAKREWTPFSDDELASIPAETRVYVKRFHREGRIVRVIPAKKLAMVQVGAMEIEVPFGGLAKLPPAAEKRPRQSRADDSPALPTPSTE